MSLIKRFVLALNAVFIQFTTFGKISQPFIIANLKKKNESVELILFYETGAEKIAYRVLSCVIYTTIKNYVYIDYLDFQSKKLSEIPVGSGGGSKHGNKSFDEILGIGIPYLLMNLMSCPGFWKNINSVVILKFPKRM